MIRSARHPSAALGTFTADFGAIFHLAYLLTALGTGFARNSLARAVFLNRLSEIRDRSFENQRYRASGLT